MLKLLFLTLSAWSAVSFSLFGTLGLLVYRRRQRRALRLSLSLQPDRSATSQLEKLATRS